ncbi:MAG: hypothetical protein HY721_17470 [Planctomycetes bacterium]|nr:hypothetical protein [Planctomycetota bacterium]
MSLRDWLRHRLRERRLRREARRLLDRAFAAPAVLAGTSLKPHHAGRTVVLRHEVEGGRVARVWFGILRHPRPYAFSRQSHKVIENYLFDVSAGRIVRLEGRNVTRERGEDADG